MCSLCAGRRGYATVCAGHGGPHASIDRDYLLIMHAFSCSQKVVDSTCTIAQQPQTDWQRVPEGLNLLGGFQFMIPA